MKEDNNKNSTIESKTVLERHKLRRYQSRYADGSDELPTKDAHVVFYSGPYVSTDGEVFHGAHVDGIRFIEDDK